MGRLNTLDFEDVIGKDKNLMKNNAHDVYLAQFDWWVYHINFIPYLSSFSSLPMNYSFIRIFSSFIYLKSWMKDFALIFMTNLQFNLLEWTKIRNLWEEWDLYWVYIICCIIDLLCFQNYQWSVLWQATRDCSQLKKSRCSSMVSLTK